MSRWWAREALGLQEVAPGEAGEDDSASLESDLGSASCRDGVPSGRIADVMARSALSGVPVTVKIASGVGGAKPPVMPVAQTVSTHYIAIDLILRL